MVYLNGTHSIYACRRIREMGITEKKITDYNKVVLDNIPHKIFLKDKNSVYLLCNKNFAKNLNMDLDDIIGKTDYDLYPKELAEKYRKDDKRIMESNDIEEKYVQNGVESIIHAVKTSVKDEKGDIVGILGILNDFTEFKRVLELRGSVREHEDLIEIARLRGLTYYTENLEKMVEARTRQLSAQMHELERSNIELDEYTFVVSHDLKAPLRTITAFSEFLLEDYMDKLDETGQGYLNRIINASTRMDRLINDLLTLSRIGRKYTETELVDLNELVEEAESDFEAQIRKRGAEILVGELPKVRTQRVWMRQLLSNLIDNGLKFNVSTTPRVEVGCEELRDCYLFSVRDNGIGIKEEDQERLFKLFQRLHTQEEYPGTGTGLAICKKIVMSFGGKIWLESHQGGGSTFYFRYPKKKAGDEPGLSEYQPPAERSVIQGVEGSSIL